MLVGVKEKSWDGASAADIDMASISRQILSLKRDPATGMMADKTFRRKLFLDKLLVGYERDLDTFDVYFFDMVGQQSQGTIN